MQISGIQAAVQAAGLDGWLFFDHHRRDPLAYRILQLSSDLQPTRRWYYFIPASGTPRKLVHQIESKVLDELPGGCQSYSSWADQYRKLGEILKGCSRVAMQYSPNCAIPQISFVDAGTVELVRSFEVEVVSSANLVQSFEACWTEEQLDSHLEAGKLVDQVRRDAFNLISDRLRGSNPITEYEVQQFILARFSELDLVADHGPIVAADSHAADPHYEPTRESAATIAAGKLVLIDMWAKLARQDAVFYDITWTGFCGSEVPRSIENVFTIVRDARKAATGFVLNRCARREAFAGFQVDDVARGYIAEKGYGERFFHRTGHSIGTEVHGTGANMDNLESHDDRLVIPGTCFSIEPGIYLAGFGIRSEVNVYIAQDDALVTGEQQEQLLRL